MRRPVNQPHNPLCYAAAVCLYELIGTRRTTPRWPLSLSPSVWVADTIRGGPLTLVETFIGIFNQSEFTDVIRTFRTSPDRVNCNKAKKGYACGADTKG